MPIGMTPQHATQLPANNNPAVAAADLERHINPAFLVHQLHDADVTAIADVFIEARSLGARAWMATSVCAGLAQARASRGDRVLDDLSRLFNLHRSRIARLGAIYRKLLLPRIEEQGEAATFILAEQAWYEIAVEAADALGRDPMELLEEAEEEKLANPRFSTRKWKERLGLCEHGAMANKLRTVLVRLAGIEDDVIEAFRGDPDRELLERAADVIDRAGYERPLGWISVLDGGMRWSYVNPDYARALGYEPEWLIGRLSTDIVLEVRELARGKAADEAEALVLRKDGTLARVVARVFTVRDHRGAPLGVVAKVLSIDDA